MILEKNVTARILEIARDLTQPTEYAMLLQKIINDAMDITNCDGGTLYIMQNGALAFMIMITRSKNFLRGGDGKPVDLPPVELDSTSVSAYVARERVTKNIADVYNDVEFNWEGPKKYDALNGYHTQSELVVPLINHEQKVIGVLQLINAQDASGNVLAFTDEEQRIVEAISSLAAVSLSNRNMIQQLQELLDSIALSFTDAIETRTQFNANHTRHVTEYCRGFAEFLTERAMNGGDNITLNDNQKAQLTMAASLHDLGKLSVPLDLLNKSDRLSYRLKGMQTRWKWLLTDLKVKYHSGMITEEEYEADK
ncbi:MAG: GAF domain-containing protein, partial [Lachnospiraceae bacterium]|nr:GAF domain-containing protein [Lachnospiraceae bacterium]